MFKTHITKDFIRILDDPYDVQSEIILPDDFSNDFKDSQLHTCRMAERLSHEFYSSQNIPDYTFKFNNIFYFLYFGHITVTEEMFKGHDELFKNVKEKEYVFGHPFASISCFKLSWQLYWTIYQIEHRKAYKHYVGATNALHDKLVNRKELIEQVKKRKEEFFGIEVSRKGLVHKRIYITNT